METAKNYTKQQLDLFESLPNKPYCMDDKPAYMLIRPKGIAVKKPYIQVNPPLMTFTLSLMMTRKILLYRGLMQTCLRRYGLLRILRMVTVTTATSLKYHFARVSLPVLKRLSTHSRFITLMQSS